MSFQIKHKNLISLRLIVCSMVAIFLILPGTIMAHECVMYGIIGDDDPFPEGLMYNNLVEDFNKTRYFGALLYGRQSHGWGVARYDGWGATYPDGDLQFYRDIDKPADCEWGWVNVDGVWIYMFIGCSAVDQDFLNMANDLDAVNPKIVLAHWRTGSSGCSGATHVNVHPFHENYDGKTWSFVQNGGVDKPRTKWLTIDGNPNEEDNDWTNNIPDGSGVEGCTSDRDVDPFGDDINNMVDSELYFKLIMKQIKEAHKSKRSTLDGIVTAITRLINHGETGGINFLMSDGYTLWGFKRGNILSYRYNAADGFSDISTLQLTGSKLDESNNVVPSGYNNDGWVSLKDYEIVICEPGKQPVVKDVRELIRGNLTCGDPDNSDACDTVVDDRDYQILANALGTCSGDEGFVERADLRGDGCITKKDVKVWMKYLDEFTTTMLCDDHMNSAMGCCRDGYIYDKYDILCGATYLPLTGAAGVIDPRREVDYFRFYAFANNQYLLNTIATRTDTYLYDTNGITELAEGDLIVWDCPLSGTYYNKVYSSSSGKGYTLSLTGPDFIAVDIDIKPGSDPNCINNNGKGVIPVAILSASGFDATQVDPSTVRLNGIGVKSNKNKLKAHIEDVDNDGDDDMIVKIGDTMWSFDEDATEAELLGALFNGTLIRGVNDICIVP